MESLGIVGSRGNPSWFLNREHPSFELPLASLRGNPLYLELELIFDLTWEDTGRYEHSLLYFAEGDADFHQDRCITFRVRYLHKPQRVRILLPPAAHAARSLRFRLDPFPRCVGGRYSVVAARLLFAEDGDTESSRIASLHGLKEFTRKAVTVAEQHQLEICEHHPGWLQMELTAKCNLTCAQCSSHGTDELHKRHNRTREFSVERLNALGTQLFPHLTAVTLTGRGEPTMVSDRLWDTLTDNLLRYDVLLSFVTNGTFIKRRLTPKLLPVIDTIYFSIDGATQDTFGANRGGASLERMWENVEFAHELRRSAQLTRRPRLAFSWTLKKNNVHEFPEFIRQLLRFDPDLIYARHLLVFFAKDDDQSLLGDPVLVNEHLSEAYRLMREHGIKSDCPPLMEVAPDAQEPSTLPPASVAPAAVTTQPDGCLFIHRTAVVEHGGMFATCAKHFGANAAQFEPDTPFMEGVWNSPVMRSVRASLNTPDEWEQCGNCWFRECRYQAQRALKDTRAELYDLSQEGKFTRKAWDYIDFKQ